MGSLSIWHWLILALVVALIFGTGKLRGAGKDLGAAIRDFKKNLNEEEETKPQEKAENEAGKEEKKPDNH